jgi:hypothetical protein
MRNPSVWRFEVSEIMELVGSYVDIQAWIYKATLMRCPSYIREKLGAIGPHNFFVLEDITFGGILPREGRVKGLYWLPPAFGNLFKLVVKFERGLVVLWLWRV